MLSHWQLSLHAWPGSVRAGSKACCCAADQAGGFAFCCRCRQQTKHVSPVWSAATPAARRGTLHIILTEEDGAALVLSPGEQKRRPQAASRIAPRNPSDLVGEVNSGGSNRRAITAAVTAQVASLDVSIAQTGMGLLCNTFWKSPHCTSSLPGKAAPRQLECKLCTKKHGSCSILAVQSYCKLSDFLCGSHACLSQ